MWTASSARGGKNMLVNSTWLTTTPCIYQPPSLCVHVKRGNSYQCCVCVHTLSTVCVCIILPVTVKRREGGRETVCVCVWWPGRGKRRQVRPTVEFYISKFYLPYAVCFSFGCLLTLAPNRSLRFSSIIIIMITTPITPNGVVFFFLPGCAMQLLSSSFGVTAKSPPPLRRSAVSLFLFFFLPRRGKHDGGWMNHHHLSEKPAHLFNDQREAHRPLISNCYFFCSFSLSQWISRCVRCCGRQTTVVMSRDSERDAVSWEKRRLATAAQ